MITLVAAVSRNNVIGRKNTLPWNVPADLKHFKDYTHGKDVIMGGRTFESLKGKPLPDRNNIVLSKSVSNFYRRWGFVKGVHVAQSIDECLSICGSGEIIVAGGFSVYEQFMDLSSRMIISSIPVDIPDGDTFFPTIDKTVWDCKAPVPYDGFDVIVYERKN